MKSKYVDTTAIVNVLGCLYADPSILDITETYHIVEDDFVEDFHKIIFGSIYTLYQHGSKTITLNAINDFLSNHPQQEATYKANRGDEYLTKIASVPRSTFDYYYKRLKKFTLLRSFDNYGIDVNFLYDPDNILDSKKKEAQEEWLDNVSLQEIASKVDERIEQIKSSYVDNDDGQSSPAGDGIMDMLAQLEKVPDVGVQLYGKYINTVTRGARLGKFYLRSAPTGAGKTRSMIADACHIGCSEEWDDEYNVWVKRRPNPTLFIGTEQDRSEIQTMMLAFLSNVNEEHILTNRYEEGEKERVYYAAKVIQSSPIYIEELPEFNLQDVENVVKRNIRERNVMYIMLDYVHTSIKMLEEISRRAGKITLREDNILFMLSARLKEIAVQYNVFILSATQLNGMYTVADTPDQNLLRGAKAIADKIDTGMLLLPVKQEDLAALEPLLTKNGHFQEPNLKLSIYKNRRGRFKSVFLWCHSDLGTCRINPMFMTDFQYEFIGIEDLKIFVDDESAF